MAKSKKKSSGSSLIMSILYIIIGIVLLVCPGEAISIAMTIAGVVFIVSGILELVRKNVLGGIISLIIGIAILVLGWVWVEFIRIFMGSISLLQCRTFSRTSLRIPSGITTVSHCRKIT